MKLFTSFPIVAALDTGAGKFISELVRKEAGIEQPLPLLWKAINGEQWALVSPEIWNPTAGGFSKLLPEELASIASWDAGVINEFLRREEMKIQLQPWTIDHSTFGIAGLIKLIGHWQSPGEKNYHVSDWKKAFRLEAGLRFFVFDMGKGQQYGVAIPSQEGDWVHIVPASSEDLNGCALLQYATRTTLAGRASTKFRGAVLPQWNFEQKVDVSSFVGLSTNDAAGNMWALAQVLMEGKSGFGYSGFTFKSAFAASVMRGGPRPNTPHDGDLIVDYPVCMSIWRPGVNIPLGVVEVLPSEFAPADVKI